MADEKPKWEFQINIDSFEKCLQPIVKITHHWRMTGNDTSENWVELHTGDKKFRQPPGFNEMFRYSPDHKGLFNLHYQGERAMQQLDAVRKWEKKNAKELAEYKRLKAKYG